MAVDKSGIYLIALERARQIDHLGYTKENDDAYAAKQLERAATAYLTRQAIYWPWGLGQFHKTPGDRIRELTKAGALIAAEIDRLNRVAS